MDFYFSGDLDNLKDYIDFNSIDLSSEGGYDKTEFKFFIVNKAHFLLF